MENADIKKMVKACCEGDVVSKQKFQAEFGDLIYNFPYKTCKVDLDRAGDFYLFVFEKDRIFKRMSTFEGENISGVNYLKFYALRDLAREWLRSEAVKAIDTEEMDNPNAFCSHEKIQAHEKTAADSFETSEALEKKKTILDLLERDDFFILRLFYMHELYEFPLPPEDIRKIASEGEKRILDVETLIAEIQNKLIGKAEKKRAMQKSRDIAWFHKLEHHRKLVELEKELYLAEQNKSIASGALKEKKDGLNRKIANRLRQIDIIARKDPDAIITTPYKDIAELLGMSVGAVSGKIARAREKFIFLVEEENKKDNILGKERGGLK